MGKITSAAFQLNDSGTPTHMLSGDGQQVNVVTATTDAVTGVVTGLAAGSRDVVVDLGLGSASLPKRTSGQQMRISARSASERGSAGTYHVTFQAAGDFYAVQPIIHVTRTPTDVTYTDDDVYDQIGVAPSATVLTGGYPDASGGAGAWTASANMTFARDANAATSTPVPVIGSLIYCSSIARTDSGPGRLLMARAYSTGASHAQAATTRMPTFNTEQATLAACQRWDDATDGFPLSAMGQYYFRSGNYASTSQNTFGSGATRWYSNCIIGMKFHYAKPTLNVLFTGDSTVAGSYDEGGNIPMRAGMGFRAGYALQAAGHLIDCINNGVNGAKWDGFGPYMQSLVLALKPDIVVMPIWTVNGVSTGVGTGNTQADADKHWAIAMYYRDWCLANGVKDVLFFTPCPQASASVVMPSLISRLIDSGLPYADINSVLSQGNSYTWKGGYSVDGTHPVAIANIAASTVLQASLLAYL